MASEITKRMIVALILVAPFHIGEFFVIPVFVAPALANEPINIGSRRELMIDDHLIGSMTGALRIQLHKPIRRNVVLVTDAPWEGNACLYSSLFHDGERFRMYYTAGQYVNRKGRIELPHGRHLCYAESVDGIHFTRPKLNLVEFGGSKANNIVLKSGDLAGVAIDPGHTTILMDRNPNCPPDARYKALVRSAAQGVVGLHALKSPDGFHFTPLTDQLIITDGYFDSENLAFWDAVRGEYRAYFRDFYKGLPGSGIRGIKTATSDDFIHWTKGEWLKYPGTQDVHLYTNQVAPYARAPHIFLGFPTRYIDRGWVHSTAQLPGLEERRARTNASPRYGSVVTDGLLMTSRDGQTFKRWDEAIIRPGPSRRDSWTYCDNLISWGMLPTKSDLPESPDELSIYAIEGYWRGKSQKFRRYAFRVDGFASARAPLAGGAFVTRPILFDGSQLHLNYSTSAAGSVYVEIQDVHGKPVKGYALADCFEIFGDEIERTVSWKGGASVKQLAGTTLRLRFVLKDADLFAFRFR